MITALPTVTKGRLVDQRRYSSTFVISDSTRKTDKNANSIGSHECKLLCFKLASARKQENFLVLCEANRLGRILQKHYCKIRANFVFSVQTQIYFYQYVHFVISISFAAPASLPEIAAATRSAHASSVARCSTQRRAAPPKRARRTASPRSLSIASRQPPHPPAQPSARCRRP